MSLGHRGCALASRHTIDPWHRGCARAVPHHTEGVDRVVYSFRALPAKWCIYGCKRPLVIGMAAGSHVHSLRSTCWPPWHREAAPSCSALRHWLRVCWPAFKMCCRGNLYKTFRRPEAAPRPIPSKQLPVHWRSLSPEFFSCLQQ